MKVYIMTDMEGVAGVVNPKDYIYPDSRYYEVAKDLVTMEVNAAIAGCLEAGATEILVVDGHGHGAINQRVLHRDAKLFTGRPMGYPFACTSDFDAAMIIGQHAKSNTDGGHISHTGSFEVENYTINGVSLGELGVNMLFTAYFGVPTVFVSGDQAVCAEAKALVPNIETVAVKEGLKRGAATGLTGEENELYNGAAIHLSPECARELIRDAARRSLLKRNEVSKFWLEPPYRREIVMRPSGGKSGKTIVNEGNDLISLLNGK